MDIRIADPGDAEALLKIYAPYVTDTAVTTEYEVPTVEEFAERIRKTLVNYPFLIGEYEGEICGFAYASPFRSRPGYRLDAETSIYIDQKRRRGGFGNELYRSLEHVLGMQNVVNLYAYIARPGQEEDEHLNSDSYLFHKRLGYRQAGELRQCSFKFNRWYSISLMEKQIGSRTSYPDEFTPFPEVRGRITSLDVI